MWCIRGYKGEGGVWCIRGYKGEEEGECVVYKRVQGGGGGGVCGA